MDGAAHATLWRDGSVIDVGGPNTFANSINELDQIVGYRLDDSFVAHAHLWPDDIDLGLIPGFNSSVATGINSSGVVVGVAYDSANSNMQTGFTWTPGSGMQAISGCASAEAINDAGQVAGIGADLDAVICGGEDSTRYGAAVAINSMGQVAGYSGADAWRFPDMDLGPTLATGINDYGWVCGYSVVPQGSVARVMRIMSVTHVMRLHPSVSGTSHPWIWSQDSGVVALPTLTTANAINQSGQIVGAVILSDGSTHGGLLTGN